MNWAGVCENTSTARCRAEAQLLTNDSAKGIGDLTMPRNWSLAPIGGVTENIVSLAMSLKHASGSLELADELTPLHTSNSTASRWAAFGAGDRSCVTINSYAS